MSNPEETVHLRKFLSGIVGNAPFGIVTLSSHREVGIINRNAVDLLGFVDIEPHELIDTGFREVFRNVPELLALCDEQIREYKSRTANINKLKLQNAVVNIKLRPLFNGSLIIIEDITVQAELENLLLHQATHDSLTTLSNRHEFEERTRQAIDKAIEHKLPGAVIFIDLDRFKPVNDSAGHAAGDKLLKHVAAMLHNTVRDRDLVARLGGDEFAVLLEDCPLSKAMELAESMRKQVSEFTFVHGKHSFVIGLCAGVCDFGRPGDQLNTIINAADNACQIAKNQGRNMVHLADASKSEYLEHKREIDWIPRIQSALASDQFVLYSQRIMAIDSGEQDHNEILLRLADDNGSLIPPFSFIPAAERYDLMADIDRWVLAHAMASIPPDTPFTINLSGQSMKNPALADFIEELLKSRQIKSENITIEITETAAIQNIDNCLTFMHKLKEKGVSFALDDFGSGLSSFTYLKNLPVDYLKIEGSFVKEIANDKVSFAMVKSINDIGHAMGLKTIAEYVENQQILDRLRELGVDYAQGYHIAQPAPLGQQTARPPRTDATGSSK